MTASSRAFIIGIVGATVIGASAFAADKVRLISSAIPVFETEYAYAAKEAGIFRKYRLELSITHGASGAGSLEAVLAGDQDVVWGTGAVGVLAAYSRGAPVRILGSNMRGVADIYWYVKSESPIRKFSDLRARHELAYSRPGSTTNLAAIYIKQALDLGARLTAVGGMPESRRQLLAGQADTGWSVFPLNNDLVRLRQIRVIGTGAAAAGLSGVTSRVIGVNSRWLKRNRRVAKRLIKALVEGQKLSYTSDAQLSAYAKRWNFDLRDVATIRQDVKLENATFLPVARLDVINRIALANRKIETRLTAKQLHELVHPMGNKPN